MTPSEPDPKRHPMRPRPPAGLAPRDPDLPFLHDALDAEAMRARLRSLEPDGPPIDRVAIAYARYKPGLSCVLEYRVADERGERTFLGRICGAAAFEILAAKTMATVPPGRRDGTTVRALPDLRLLLTAFPFDRVVRGLRHALDAHRLKRILHRVAARYRPDRHWVSGSHSRVTVVTYKPERRCLLRCDLGIRDRENGSLRRETIYARVYGDASGRRVFDLLQDLHRPAPSGPGGAPVPRPLGYDPDRRILFFEEVPGEPVFRLSGERDFEDAAEKAGAILARLHAAGVEVPLRLRPERILSEAWETAVRLSAAGVEEAAALLHAIERLRGEPPTRDGTALVCLHGDFHPGQILTDGASWHCVDLDETGMGEASFDLGYFTAHLRRLVRLGLADEARERRCAERFVAGYAGAGGRLPTPEVLGWHRDLTLLRMALSSLKHLEAGWPETMRFFLGGIGR